MVGSVAALRRTRTNARAGPLALLPLYLWLLIFVPQAHKEERFMFPVYPLLCLAAAVGVERAAAILGWILRSKVAQRDGCNSNTLDLRPPSPRPLYPTSSAPRWCLSTQPSASPAALRFNPTMRRPLSFTASCRRWRPTPRQTTARCASVSARSGTDIPAASSCPTAGGWRRNGVKVDARSHPLCHQDGAGLSAV